MNIYVGNLPHATTEESLRDLFAQFGDVASVRIMKDKLTGALRGFAFVEMVSATQAQEAIAELNNCDFGGQRLRVNEARPREARPAHRPNNRRPFNNKRSSF
jgi:RNA recognition motif-containing protein